MSTYTMPGSWPTTGATRVNGGPDAADNATDTGLMLFEATPTTWPPATASASAQMGCDWQIYGTVSRTSSVGSPRPRALRARTRKKYVPGGTLAALKVVTAPTLNEPMSARPRLVPASST